MTARQNTMSSGSTAPWEPQAPPRPLPAQAGPGPTAPAPNPRDEALGPRPGSSERSAPGAVRRLIHHRPGSPGTSCPRSRLGGSNEREELLAFKYCPTLFPLKVIERNFFGEGQQHPKFFFFFYVTLEETMDLFRTRLVSRRGRPKAQGEETIPCGFRIFREAGTNGAASDGTSSARQLR